MLLFKFLSPEGALKALKRKGSVSLRFGLPRSYNDPYELFLQPDPPLRSEKHRAFYDFFLGEVLQAPITCFSKRPDSVAMWAHYGHEGRGACIAFDERALARQFDLAWIGDVAYSPTGAAIPAGLVAWAYETGKRRHSLALLSVAHRAAYFIKRVDWAYEAERRLIVHPEDVRRRGDMLLARVSSSTVRYIVVGANADQRLRSLCKLRAAQMKVPFLLMKSGRRSYLPIFSKGRRTLKWITGRFVDSHATCGECCAELMRSGRCRWCDISLSVRRSAPLRSLLAATLHVGIETGIPMQFDGILPRGRRSGRH